MTSPPILEESVSSYVSYVKKLKDSFKPPVQKPKPAKESFKILKSKFKKKKVQKKPKLEDISYDWSKYDFEIISKNTLKAVAPVDIDQRATSPPSSKREIPRYMAPTISKSLIPEESPTPKIKFRYLDNGELAFTKDLLYKVKVDEIAKIDQIEDERKRKLWEKVSSSEYKITDKLGNELGYSYNGFRRPVSEIEPPPPPPAKLTTVDSLTVSKPKKSYHSNETTEFVEMEIIKKSESFVQKQRQAVRESRKSYKKFQWSPGVLPSTSVPLDRKHALLPYSCFITWPHYLVDDTMDMFVSVEYCNKCYEHEELTRHDEHCYQEMTEKIVSQLTSLLTEYGLKFEIIKIPLEESLRLLDIPTFDDPLRGKRSSSATTLPSEHGMGHSTTANFIRDRFALQVDSYQRVGVFEIQAYLFKNGDRRKPITHIIHSKLFSGRWPSASSIENRIRFLLHDCNYHRIRPMNSNDSLILTAQNTWDDDEDQPHREEEGPLDLSATSKDRNILEKEEEEEEKEKEKEEEVVILSNRNWNKDKDEMLKNPAISISDSGEGMPIKDHSCSTAPQMIKSNSGSSGSLLLNQLKTELSIIGLDSSPLDVHSSSRSLTKVSSTSSSDNESNPSSFNPGLGSIPMSSTSQSKLATKKKSANSKSHENPSSLETKEDWKELLLSFDKSVSDNNSETSNNPTAETESGDDDVDYFEEFHRKLSVFGSASSSASSQV